MGLVSFPRPCNDDHSDCAASGSDSDGLLLDEVSVSIHVCILPAGIVYAVAVHIRC